MSKGAGSVDPREERRQARSASAPTVIDIAAVVGVSQMITSYFRESLDIESRHPIDKS